LLFRFSKEELSAADKRKVLLHLGQCAIARRELAQWDNFKTNIKQFKPPQPFHIEHRVLESVGIKHTLGGIRFRWVQIRWALLGMAILILIGNSGRLVDFLRMGKHTRQNNSFVQEANLENQTARTISRNHAIQQINHFFTVVQGWSGTQALTVYPFIKVFKSQKQFLAIWQILMPTQTLPPIDFHTHQVLLIVNVIHANFEDFIHIHHRTIKKHQVYFYYQIGQSDHAASPKWESSWHLEVITKFSYPVIFKLNSSRRL
jgi:hypothetical protein